MSTSTARRPYLVAPDRHCQPARVPGDLDLTQHAEDVHQLRGAVAMLHLIVANQINDSPMEIDWVGVLTLVQDAETAAHRADAVALWLQGHS